MGKFLNFQSSSKAHYGKFSNGVPFLRWGEGTKKLLFLLGGPGNSLPKGIGLSGFKRIMRGFAGEYSVYLVSRKSDLPDVYSTRDMSNDYAELIKSDLDGQVDLIFGFSFGGLILQHFAADHSRLAKKIVIGGAANRVSEQAKRIDWDFATLINQGKDRQAMACRAEAVFPNGMRYGPLYGVLWLLGKVLLGTVDSVFRKDVLVEARAELSHDATESLKRIAVPVLVICGKDDFAFSVNDVREMVAMIPFGELKIYEKGHSTFLFDPRFEVDVKEWVRRSP